MDLNQPFMFQLAETWKESKFAYVENVLRWRPGKVCFYFGHNNNRPESSSSAKVWGEGHRDL